MSAAVKHHGDKNGDRVVTCPKCGRTTIDVRRYTGRYADDVCYVHAQHIAPPFGFIDVTDSCYVAAKDARAVAP